MLLSKKLRQVIQTPSVDPWEFCQQHGVFELRAEDRGYRALCVKFLASILNVAPSSVERWGSRFERMPEWARRQLSYLDLLAHPRADL